MTIQSKEEHILFLDNNILKPIKSNLDNNQFTITCLLIGIAIEFLGSYFDNKPIRVKQQSQKRFNIAINKLFKNEYRTANASNYLYFQLRTCLTHSFAHSAQINILTNKLSNKHLSTIDGIMQINIYNLYNDFENAVKKTQTIINNDKVKLKILSIGNIIAE